MSNPSFSRYEKVPGKTRYVSYYKVRGLRVRFIILSNYSPGKYWWEPSEHTKSLTDEERKTRREQFESRFDYYRLDAS